MAKTYTYKNPRRINVVSVALTLLALALAYAGWKFVPVYYMGYKVETALQNVMYQAADLPVMSGPAQRQAEQKFLKVAYAELRALGVDDPHLRIQFGPDRYSLHASYRVIVPHPVGKPTELDFAKTARLRRGPGMP